MGNKPQGPLSCLLKGPYLVSFLPDRPGGLAGLEGNVTHLRTLIASLEAGLAFSRAMSRSLPLVTQLLASSTLSDTQEAISLLIMCSKFGISGADSALRKMLPLVFCPEQGLL